ncbi:class I SAM-dependent methyltransferase [Patescibacteria group bacterium]|nr:class I SAM-dependent methyltransferase [Patescibacteria group bacterium]MBU2259989.1 class I SAM-dependent methyltransferase [Patescibacteria group bacterium]
MYEYLPFTSTKLDLSLIKDLDGWLSDKEAALLYRLAKRCTGRGAIVEIGSWKGKSTICLAEGSRAGKNIPIYAIDPHTGSSEHGDVYTFEEFKKNISNAGIENMIHPIVKTSKEASEGWNKPIELLWIDGAHEEEYVRLDYELWTEHLVPGGTIAFHDSSMPGVKIVLEQYLYKGNVFRNIRFVHGATYARKGRALIFCNRGMLLLRDIAYRLWQIKHFFKKRKDTS